MDSLSIEEKEYYSRQLMLPDWGTAVQVKLKNALVVVVGAGALGCATLQSIARAGVGNITIIDDDTITPSNLQRQILYDMHDIGKKKSVCAAEKINIINPKINITAVCDRISNENIKEALKRATVVVDATDNFRSKFLLNDACAELHTPLVSGGIEFFEGQISVYHYRGGPSYRDLFPIPPDTTAANDCNSIGVSPHLPQIIGTLQAGEVIKIITGIGEVLSGKFLRIDVLKNEFITVNFLPDSSKNEIKKNPPEKKHSIIGVTTSFFKTHKNDFYLIDVRSTSESLSLGGEHIPIYELEEWLKKNAPQKNILTYCNTGKTAQQAALLISHHTKKTAYFLDATLNAMIKS